MDDLTKSHVNEIDIHQRRAKLHNQLIATIEDISICKDKLSPLDHEKRNLKLGIRHYICVIVEIVGMGALLYIAYLVITNFNLSKGYTAFIAFFATGGLIALSQSLYKMRIFNVTKEKQRVLDEWLFNNPDYNSLRKKIEYLESQKNSTKEQIENIGS